jgi:hypothetical protein
MAVLVALTPLIGACSADLSLSANSLKPTMQRPDWLSYSGSKQEFTLRPVTANDLVSPQGQCPPDPLVAGSASTPDEGSVPLVSGGIALQMTECDVVRRAGAPDNIQVGSNDRGERETVLTYNGGVRPGVYRFTSGRLSSIEGVAAPPPPAATKRPTKRG